MRTKRLLGYLFAVVFILACWQITAMLINSSVLPSPIEAVPMLFKYSEQLAPAFLVSLYRVFAAIVLGTVIAAPLGLLIGCSKKLNTLFAPVLFMLYPIPKVVLLPVFLVLLGIADAPKITLIAVTIFFQVIISMRDATINIPESAIRSVQALGGTKLHIFRYVLFPATIPSLFTALRVSTGTAVAILFFAEAIAGSTGLGYFIIDSWAMLDYPRMFAGIIGMAILGVLLYELFDFIERRIARRR